MEHVKQRRTIRKYADKPIEPALLDELLETAGRASTMGNLQLYSVVVTRDRAMKEKLAPAHFNQPMVTDTLLYAQTFCTLAEEQGLGICYLGTTIYQPDVLIDTLKLPKLVMPVTTVTVGYPAEHPEQPDRLPAGAFVHEETYHDYTSADIDRLYAYKEALPENRHFVEINHTETLAQIFTDIRYTKKDNEAMSETYLAAMKRQGFLK